MSLIKKSLIAIVIGIAFMIGGWHIACYGDNYVSQETMETKEKLCKKGAVAIGSLKDSVMESTIKVGKVKVKMYEYKYEYLVAGISYTAKSVTNSDTAQPLKEIWYNHESPSEYSTTSPCKDLENYKLNKKVGSGMLFYIMGGIMMLTGFGITWGTTKSTIVTLIRGNKK